jgi:branched-chain amino acid transport system ATP-binding protein
MREENQILRVAQLKVTINKSQILDDISFDVSCGQTLGIIGPNGSGKTTLFNCLSGFIAPESGSIKLYNDDITNLSPHLRALKGIGRTFQNFGIFQEMTVLENVQLALEARCSGFVRVMPWGREQKRLREEAKQYLLDIDLIEKANQKAGLLSGGQMRLLEIVRILAFGAELFLLDEPTAGVAPNMKHTIVELLVKLQKTGKTVLIIEHDIQFLDQLASRIICLSNGRIAIDGSPETIRRDNLLHKVYFGHNS